MTKAKQAAAQPALFEDKAAAEPAKKAAAKSAPAAPVAKAEPEKSAPPKRSKKSTPAKAVAVAEPKPASKGEVVPFKPKEPASMVGVLLSVAKNKEVDPVKARELFALWQETEAKQQFHDALLTVDLPSINKDGMIEAKDDVDARGRKKKPIRFASFENVHKAIMPTLRAAGFRLSFQPMPGPNGEGLVVECRLIRGIYEERCVVPISTNPASRAMNAQQATGAAIKYASRYGMMALLNLRSEWHEDADLDGNDPGKVKARRTNDGVLELKAAGDEPITDQQAEMLLVAIDESGIEIGRFIEKYKIAKAADLPASQYDEAIASLTKYKAEAAKRKAAS